MNINRAARNRSFGVVGHLTRNISVHYNNANNQGLPNPTIRIIDPGDPSGSKAASRARTGKNPGLRARVAPGAARAANSTRLP